MTRSDIRETYLYTLPADADGIHGTLDQRLAFGNAFGAGEACIFWMEQGISGEDIAKLARDAAHHAFDALPSLRESIGASKVGACETCGNVAELASGECQYCSTERLR